MECRHTSRFTTHCACGALLYEDAGGWVYCVDTNQVIGRDRPAEPKHTTSCHRDEEGTWDCKEHCPVKRAQVARFS